MQYSEATHIQHTEGEVMRLCSLMVAAALAFTLPALAADDHTPKHGGVVVETKNMDIELVAKSDVIQIYLNDHGKPIDYSKATAKVTLLTGNEKQDVELKPAGNKLEAKGSFKIGVSTKVVVHVSAAGKSSTARFALR